jgi:hypothetical protein
MTQLQSGFGRHEGVSTGPGEPHLELLLLILRGIPVIRREEWMRKWCPRTLALLGASQLFDTGSVVFHSRPMREVTTGSMARPQRGAYL